MIAACQRADWPTHRANRRDLQAAAGARFLATITSSPPFPSSLVSRRTRCMSPPSTDSTASTPVSQTRTCGNSTETVRRPRRTSGATSSSSSSSKRIYDRKRSFDFYFLRKDIPAVFADFYAEMCGPHGGYGGLKMYRWAKRTGDWELKVCLDRAPTTDTRW